ncbi:UNVERIFIED_CONTAM: hypothetical protein GTU68_030844 [Idotea baltica]|nr:hypothetical protein [Idotea baltica]
MSLSRTLWRRLLSVDMRSARWLNGLGSAPSRCTLGRHSLRSHQALDQKWRNRLLR